MSKTLTYLFDPLCGWCYGASPALASIVESTGVGLELLPTGLFAGHGARPMDMSQASHAWTNDQRIEEITGQIFSLTYREQVLCNLHQPMDSTAATLALTAVAQTQPQREFEALQCIQHARYVDGCNITELGTLCELLRGLGLRDAAERLQAATPELHAATNQRIDRACVRQQHRPDPGWPLHRARPAQRFLCSKLRAQCRPPQAARGPRLNQTGYCGLPAPPLSLQPL